ncbi:hypothetical protein BUE93_12585 [Chromobacterium amazonense]|uniref:Flagellin n=1 Tax=Chromobacterium amazonense TaxID=1382803 RepID=A0A2S9X468_9NEIS|nr:flagellin [Chromobacterium amazonense]PRP70475.1 hypothetical protein BUE93_12585 [Chromobacterium amazonense]
MLSLYTNIAALNTKSNMNSTQGALSTSMTRLGTGLRINSAMDDAAGLQIATRLDAQSRGMTVAMKNAQNGISMMQTAEGALGEVTNILQRMKDLSTEGANATSTDADKKAMQSEFDQLGKELSNIMKNTSFGGEKLLQGGKISGTLSFQIGAAASESMSVDLSAQMSALGNALAQVSSKNYFADAASEEKAVKEISDQQKKVADAKDKWDKAAAGTDKDTAKGEWDTAVAELEKRTKGDEIGKSDTITTISAALDAVGTVRSSLGANANRLDHVVNNLNNVNNNTLAAKGRIMDTDYAVESSTMTAKQMLMQASTSMLKQSGSMNSLAMSLLQ